MRPADDRRSTARCPPRSTCPPWSTPCSTSGARTTSSPGASTQSEGRPDWVFYEGPPTANGMPGTHHIEARVFKDVFPRFRTMRGYHVARKAGWDCHGLPVELAVEKELGFTGKQDIEAYGIAEFNARCRESVTRHTDAFAELTERMGYWVDLDNAYRTMDPELHRVRLVVAQGDLRQGPAGPGLPRRALVPALTRPPCPTTSWRRATRRSSTPRSSSASR